MMITEQRIYEIAAEVVASFERIHGLLERLGAFSEPEESHRARDLRMSEDDIRRILNRSRILVAEAPPEAVAFVNARADEIEMKLELAHWLEATCDQARGPRHGVPPADP